MATDERRLLSVLDRLSDPAKVRHAVLIDLSGIENADEPVLHRTLWDWLRGPGGGRRSRSGRGRNRGGGVGSDP